MAAVAYRYYRIYITKSVEAGTTAYRTINEFALYDTASGVSTNLSIGSVATASSQYTTATAAKFAIDGNAGTYWESGEEDIPDWLMVTLPVAKIVRSFRVTNTTYPNEAPRDYIFQGSQDKITWVDLYEKADNVQTTFFVPFCISVSGLSKLSTGESSLGVFVHKWDTGELLKKITPNADGSWICPVIDSVNVMVTHIGPSGFEPKCDGPITPQSW